MAVSLDELDLDFGLNEDLNSKSTEKKSCFFGRKHSQENPPKDIQEARTVQQNKQANSSRRSSNGRDTCGSKGSFSFNENSQSPSSSTELISRVGAAIEKERKIFMGQNALDQRRSSYTALTAETISELSTPQYHVQDNNNRVVISETCTPRPHTQMKYDTKADFDSPFAESKFVP